MTGPDPLTEAVPDPGSRAAEARGCTCPIIDNCGGRGAYCDGERYGWWMSANCPLHGQPTPQEGEP